jgi:hypothetical protein
VALVVLERLIKDLLVVLFQVRPALRVAAVALAL